MNARQIMIGNTNGNDNTRHEVILTQAQLKANLHVYVKRDPMAGTGGCQAYLPCPGSGNPEQLPTSTVDPQPQVLDDAKDASELPFSGSCKKMGESLSWDGSCDARNYTYTEQCILKDMTDDEGNEGCSVQMNSCGCLWWEEDDASENVSALHSKSCTDPCAVHGYTPLPSSANVYGLTTAFGVAAMSVAWYVL